MWEYIEDLLYKKELLGDSEYYEIFENLRPSTKKWARRAHFRALLTGVCIPEDDFISYFEEAIWKGIKFFKDNPEEKNKYELSHIITHRIRIAEASVWRNYKNSGTKADKDCTQYLSARWTPLEFDQEVAIDVLDKVDLTFQIEDFQYQFPDEGKVVGLLANGYSPKEISLDFFNDKEYSAKYRKRINRIREKFKTFLMSEA